MCWGPSGLLGFKSFKKVINFPRGIFLVSQGACEHSLWFFFPFPA